MRWRRRSPARRTLARACVADRTSARQAPRWWVVPAALCIGATCASLATGEVRIQPSLQIAQEYSDNVDLDADDEQSAFITRVTPGVVLRGRSSRFNGALNASVPARYTTEGDNEGVEVNGALTGLGDAELIRDWFFVEGRASVSQQVLDNDLASTEANQDTVQVYQVSPVLRRQIKNWAVAELRYVFGQTLIASEDAADTTGHAGAFALSSGSDFYRLRWALNGTISDASRDDASNVERRDAGLSAEYGVTRWVSVVGSGGYQFFDAGERSSNFQGPAYRGGLGLRPGRRTELIVTYGKSDDRFSPAADLRFKISETSQLIAGYGESISTSQGRLLSNLNFIELDPETGRFVDQRFGTAFDPRPDPFDVDDEIEFIKAARAALLIARGRNTFNLSGFWGQEEKVDTGEEEDIARIDGGWSRRLNRRTVVSVGGGYKRIEFDDGRDDDEYVGQIALSYQLAENLSLVASYRYRQQVSSDEQAEYEENRVVVAVGIDF